MTDRTRDNPKPRTRANRPLTWRLVRLTVLLITLGLLLYLIPTARLQWRLQAGQAALNNEEPAEALVEFERALELAPDTAAVHFWLARTWRKLGDLDRIRHHLDEASRLGYEDPQRLRNEWYLVLAQTGRVPEVERYLGAMLVNSEDTTEVCEAFTRGYCLNLNFRRAEALLDAWQADHPDDYRPWFYRGQIHSGNERWSEAESAYRKAWTLAPHSVRVRRGLGLVLIHQRQLDEAENLLAGVLDEEPDDVTARIGLAGTLSEKRAYASAVEQLRRVLADQPDHFGARLKLAKALLADGRTTAACREAESLVDEWPEDLQAVYTLASALRADGRVDEAEQQFEHYAELSDVLPRLEELRRDVSETPDSPELRFELGRLVLQHLSRDEGVVWLQSVFYYEPGHVDAHRALADYYRRIGDTETARAHERLAEQSASADAGSRQSASQSSETP